MQELIVIRGHRLSSHWSKVLEHVLDNIQGALVQLTLEVLARLLGELPQHLEQQGWVRHVSHRLIVIDDFSTIVVVVLLLPLLHHLLHQLLLLTLLLKHFHGVLIRT
mmetsp:Transcript_1852/g.1765  ORF Transcript_1852/g.1765 Transcript_1852/m.1765 type:complete len:107 (-) Transcript_1852:728-1048(-)